MTEFAFSRVVTVVYLFIITIYLFFIFTGINNNLFSWILLQTPEKVFYLKDCQDTLRRQEKRTNQP